jgi:hypothetical protein
MMKKICLKETKDKKKHLSDDDDENSDKEIDDAPSTKKRGRPKKVISPRQNIKADKQNKFFSQDIESGQESNSIILHLALRDDDESSETSNKAKLTLSNKKKNGKETVSKSFRELSVSDYEDSDEEIQENDKKNLSVYLSDESDDAINVKYLKKELKKKSTTIKKLQDEISAKSEYCAESYVVQKIMNTKKVSTKLINVNSEFPITEKTKVACWWCTHNFDTLPCYIPDKYYKDKYYVFGCFCSYNCALAYILKDDEYKIATRRSLVKMLYAELYETDEPLCASPPKEILKKFGGPLTIEEYRDTRTLASKDYKMIITQTPCYFEETYKDPMILTTRSKFGKG